MCDWDGMKREAARKWLHHVRASVTDMRSIEDAVLAERDRCDMLKSIAYDGDGRHSQMLHGDDAIAGHIVHLDELVGSMVEMGAGYAKDVNEARDVFSRLECHDLAGSLLDWHYLQRLTWERTAAKVGYSEDRAKSIAADATLECYELMPHEWRIKLPRAD